MSGDSASFRPETKPSPVCMRFRAHPGNGVWWQLKYELPTSPKETGGQFNHGGHSSLNRRRIEPNHAPLPSGIRFLLANQDGGDYRVSSAFSNFLYAFIRKGLKGRDFGSALGEKLTQ